ncbi:hypothetical protein ACFVXC_06015 [Streptomyces sp. NPDC058257]|uniref:hypothetical protein n=1 Tax=Streptomyces sp. NPDC058257 TaxID=3346409 RepID=UPI0036EE6CB7
MADLNSRQFRQPAFRGFGDQAMRSHRVTPTPASDPASAPAARPQGQQASLFSADEVRNPQGPPAPTFNASQFRISRPALPGMSTRSMASQRVTPPPEPAESTQAPASSNWTQPELTMLGPTPSSPSSPGAAGPSPTHWPAPTDSTAPAPAARTRQPVTINGAAYAAAGQRFGPEPVADQNISMPGRPAPPPPATPAAPPATPATGSSSAPAWVGRTARYGGLAVGLGAKAFTSINNIATDPKRSGNPLYKSTGGWAKS